MKYNELVLEAQEIAHKTLTEFEPMILVQRLFDDVAPKMGVDIIVLKYEYDEEAKEYRSSVGLKLTDDYKFETIVGRVSLEFLKKWHDYTSADYENDMDLPKRFTEFMAIPENYKFLIMPIIQKVGLRFMAYKESFEYFSEYMNIKKIQFKINGEPIIFKEEM